jgi:hypothetical protein
MPLHHPPKRSATYPGNLHAKRPKKVALQRDFRQEPSLPPVSSPEAFLESYPEGRALPINASELRWHPDSHEQFSDSSYLSTTEGSQASNDDEDFMEPLGGSWALDQCNSLYHVLDGEYSYGHDISPLANPYQTQGTSGYSFGQNCFDTQMQPFVGDIVQALAM